MKRVLITGGSGFLGARILQQGLGDAELCSLPRGFLAAAGEAEVTETIQKLQPAAIVHAAALSDTGYCAQHPEEAHRANVELPVWVVKAACASGAKLLAFSSDQVYAGITQPGPLPETLPLQPTNVYGISIISVTFFIFFGIVSLVLNIKNNRRTDNSDLEDRVRENTRINMKLDAISSNTKDIKDEVVEMRKELNSHDNRIIKVEERVKSLHHSIPCTILVCHSHTEPIL